MDPTRKLLQSTDPTTYDGISSDPIFNISSSTAKRPLSSNTPFDSSMALTILVLLTALFFMGFFSAYLRRYTTDNNSDQPPSQPDRKRGLDPKLISSLPMVAYGKAAKHPMIDDCPICLNEFEETESVKLVPYCGHVFHPSCVDTWLSTHVTCPLCRSAQLFKDNHRKDGVGLDGGNPDTWRDLECGCSPAVERRSTSL